MKLFFTDEFELPLPPEHRFPMAKYRLLRERLSAESWTRPDMFRRPAAATPVQLALAHCPHYVDRVLRGGLSAAEIRRIGFPWSLELVERSRRSVGATLEAARAALNDGAAANLAGGTHHAQYDCGEGYCVFNDVAVAIRSLQREGVRRAVVIDCDVHQGNGTAQIFHQDPSVYTFSIHGARNFPARKFASDLDVGLEDGAGDKVYLEALRQALTRLVAEGPFDLAFYVAGADPYHDDRLGRLRLTKRGLAERDELVLQTCRDSGWPLAVTMAGGYAHRIEDIADIHARTIRATHLAFDTT